MMHFSQTKLRNGLKVVSVPMKARRSSAVAIWVRAGARYEAKPLSGVSHFLEHMLFKGTQKRTTRQIKEEIEGVGGLLNAFTGEECTCYFAKLLKEHYPKALDVLSDMVAHAALDTVELEKERTVIIEEIKMYRDLPGHYVHDLIGGLLWPEAALGRPIAGTVESVSGISRASMAGYKKRFYHPKNIVISVSGSIPETEIRELAERCFPGAGTQPKARFRKAELRQAKPQTLFLEKQTEQTHFVVGLHAFSRHHPDRYKLGLLNLILGGNMSSRLFEELREKRGLAYEIKSGLNFYEDTGSLLVSAGVETRKTGLALSVILKEFAKIKKRGIKTGELRRAKDYFMSQLHMIMEDTLDHLLWTGERAVYSDEIPSPEKICREIESVTLRDLQELAGRVFVTRHLNLALIGPVTNKDQKRIKQWFEIPGA